MYVYTLLLCFYDGNLVIPLGKYIMKTKKKKKEKNKTKNQGRMQGLVNYPLTFVGKCNLFWHIGLKQILKSLS